VSSPRRSPSITAVAALAGVSIATVSRVMNGVANKASSETADRVRRAAASLDYRPLAAGRALRSRQTRMVAVLASNLANPTMAAIAASAETALRQAGFVMVLCDTHDEPELQDEYLREMRARQAHAIVLLGAVASPALDRLPGSEERIVFVNRRAPRNVAKLLSPTPFATAPFVGIDNEAAGADVASLCLQLGCSSIAVIHGSLASSATAERLSGIRRALDRAGRLLPDDMILTGGGREHLEIGYEVGRRLAASGAADAVIALSDLIAFGAHRAFAESGLEGPRFFGFDDNPLNPWIAPWLSSVRIPYAEYGAAIVASLAARTEAEPRGTILPHEIILRPPRT